jgi:hypothetical protein
VKHCGRCFIAVVRQKNGLQVMRGDWDGRVSSVASESGQVGMKSLALVLDEHERDPQRVMPSAFGIAAVATSAGQWWTLRGSAGEFILECRGDDGRLTGSTALTSLLDEVEGPIESISMLALGTRVWVALAVEAQEVMHVEAEA